MTKRKRLVVALDALFSQYIRLRDKRIFGGCFFCGKPIQCVFHMVTRAKHAVRWDTRNGVGACSGCNLRYEYDPHGFVRIYVERFGQEAWNKLINDGCRVARFSIDDLRRIRATLEAELAGACATTKTFGAKTE